VGRDRRALGRGGDLSPVAKLSYSAIASLDGYVEDGRGRIEWSAPDEEVLAFINELERPIGTYLYGRRMYEAMLYWETVSPDDLSRGSRDFTTIWRKADKVVFSRTLAEPTSGRTRIERSFDADVVRLMKESSALDLSVGGAELAGQALGARLVDECHLFVVPVILGGGKPALPSGVATRLELVDVARFDGGVVHLHYRVLA
jgi:dihydrofolate reductase